MSEHEKKLRLALLWFTEMAQRSAPQSNVAAVAEGARLNIAALLEEHRKALVRARNEGLERAAEFVRREMVEGDWCADGILAMMETEK